MLVSIITPAHNEAGIVKNFVDKALGFLKRNKLDGEVIVVENGSSDDTWGIVKKIPGVKALHISEGNKGKALKVGMETARGEYLITLDTDLWDEDFVSNSIEHLKNYAIVVGSKALKGSTDKRPLASRLLNWGYNFIFHLVFNLQGTETHAKLAFRRDKVLALIKKCKTEDLNFDTELIIRAEREGLSKLEIPTNTNEIRPRRFSLKSQLPKTIKNFLIIVKTLGPSPNWTYVLVGAALALAVYMRLANLSDWFFFSVDEEHYSFMTRMITVDHHLPLIGGPISGTKLYMAPWFLYFNAIFFLFSGNSPLVSGVVFSLMECSVIVLIYLIGKRLFFSNNAGVIAALLYASSFLMALFDRHYWNITLIPLISTLVLYSLIRYLDDDRRWLWVVALVVGFGLSTTFSVFAIFLFALIVIAFFKKPILKKDLAIFIFIVALLHLPLVLFDLRHDFWLTKGLIEFITSPRSAQSGNVLLSAQTLAKSIAITNPIDVSDEISICYEHVSHYKPQLWTIFLALASLVVYLVTALKAQKKEVWLIGLLLLVNLSSLFLFRTDAAERHWLPFLPAFFITLGLTISLVFQKFKIIAVVLILIIISFNIYSFSNSYASFGYTKKLAAVEKIISETKPGKFSLNVVGDCHKWGYRYLFSMLGHEPASSYLDDSFEWMYSQKPQSQNSEKQIKISAPNAKN